MLLFSAKSCLNQVILNKWASIWLIQVSSEAWICWPIIWLWSVNPTASYETAQSREVSNQGSFIVELAISPSKETLNNHLASKHNGEKLCFSNKIGDGENRTKLSLTWWYYVKNKPLVSWMKNPSIDSIRWAYCV